jgi:hypothetical protein
MLLALFKEEIVYGRGSETLWYRDSWSDTRIYSMPHSTAQQKVKILHMAACSYQAVQWKHGA